MRYFICLKCGYMFKKIGKKQIRIEKREWANDKYGTITISNCKGKCKIKSVHYPRLREKKIKQEKGIYSKKKQKNIKSKNKYRWAYF